MEKRKMNVKHTEEYLQEIERFSQKYREFLNECKTERECVEYVIRLAKEVGYKAISEVSSLKKGDRVYCEKMGKALAMFHIGEAPLEKGLLVLGTHVDSPRLDIKQCPLYEKSGLCYMDTHYYGGIKKYQWATIPLAIHGIIVKQNGERIHVVWGENDDEASVYISDIPIHLSKEQADKKGINIIDGEALDVIVGNQITVREEEHPVKSSILQLLKSKYDVVEEDFLSAELEVVPAGKARNAGIDNSMLIGYGHDDRACVFAAVQAMLCTFEYKEITTCCLLFDKEEVGSIGATGARSDFFENSIAEVLDKCGKYSELTLRRCLDRSKMLSCDVTTGYDPLYATAFDSKTSAYLGNGVAFMKFTGNGGKSGGNDASPEYIAYLRNIMDRAVIPYQMVEIGRVDAGGGGTIAGLFGKYGIDVIDCGIPVLSMHAPWELISKSDLYETYRCYNEFLTPGK